MKIKKGDTVKIISGDERRKRQTAREGKEGERKQRPDTGKVLEVFPQDNRVLVENLNKVVRHTKPRKMGQNGGRVQKEAPINASNVQIVCPKCGKPTRVGVRVEGTGDKAKKVRFCKKTGCGASID